MDNFYNDFIRVQIAIGPYEVKEDTFAGLKAAFEAFVYVTNLPEEQVECPASFLVYLMVLLNSAGSR